MKPIKARYFLVQNLLITLSVVLAIVACLLAQRTVVVYDGIFGYLNQNNVRQPITLGIFPLANLALFLGYIFIYLNFEFYGFKSALYNTIGACLAMALTFVLFKLFVAFGLPSGTGNTDPLVALLHPLSRRLVVTLILSTASGFFIALFLAAAIKKLTRSYFMIIRFPIATALGFGVFTCIGFYLTNLPNFSTQTLLVTSATPAAQFLGLTILSVVPLYVLRLVFGLFRGRRLVREDAGYGDDDDRASQTALFKGSLPSDLLPPPPLSPDQEDTVSQKIKKDKIDAAPPTPDAAFAPPAAPLAAPASAVPNTPAPVSSVTPPAPTPATPQTK